MPIPKELKNKKAWTLSDKDKRPLDVGFLHSASEYVLYTPKIGSMCYTYDICKQIQNNFPDTRMTLNASELENVTLVDIEQEGNYDWNPYKNLDFVYLEESSGGGLHGLLDYTLDTRPIIKDHELETEFFNDNHFMIITEKELPLPDNPVSLFKFKERFAPKQETDDTLYELDKEAAHNDLSKIEKYVIDNLLVEDYEINQGDDKSKVEFTYLMRLGHIIQEQLNYEDINKFVAYLAYFADLHLPYRKKHREVFESEQYGKHTKRMYMIYKASEYLHKDA